VNDRNLVPFSFPLRRPDPARVAEFAETARRLQRERATSEDIVTNALRNTPRAAWTNLREQHELHTSGALERLGQEVEKRLDTDPREALAIAELAAAIADALSPQSYPAIIVAQLRAHAWKDRGQALSYLGRYEEALRALDRAEEQFDRFGTLAHDRAMVRFCRATLLQHLRRFDEAQAILNECRDVFNAHGDTRLYTKCTMATANLLVRRGDYRAAREILGGLVGSGDSVREATVRCTLGWCAIQLGAFEEALSHFHAVAQCVSKSPVHLARAEYGTGAALLRLGSLGGAVEHLHAARHAFLDHGLIEEAGLCGLEIVEARLIQSDRAAAQSLSAQIVSEFVSAKLSRRAITALAYLQDLVAATTATAETARNVRNYITALRVDPNCEFAAIN
jgi:tetratricopeptide (TPR) repeat protein